MTETFIPDYAVHPGKTLKESIDSSEMTQVELAARTGLHRKTINGIINGKEPLTHDTAIQLEKVFRVPAKFWVNLQANYDEALARIKERAKLEEYKDWIKKQNIPYNELSKRGLVPKTRDNIERVSSVLQFFGLSSPEAFNRVWSGFEQSYTFRRNGKASNHFGAIATWLRLGEIEASKIICSPFNKTALENSLEQLRSITLKTCEEFQSEMVQICASCGVAVVFVPGIKGAPIYGATRWLSSDKAIVQLSLRGKDDGNFWFTFFHELCHVLYHEKKKIFLELDSEITNEQEEEANKFSRDWLIPPKEMKAFLDSHPKNKIKKCRMISKRDILQFASKIGIPPGIVVGRLQFDEEIPFKNCNELKDRFDFDSDN